MKPTVQSKPTDLARTPGVAREKQSLAELLARSMEDDALDFSEPTANDSFDDDCSSGG